jgi:catechol 2,3-dioxygenase-like lactoylglutathione lyase family enzyme
MSLELYMLGVIVKDMPQAIEFYRRLGVDVPEGSETKEFVEIKMGKLTFFLATEAQNKRWDPNRPPPAIGGYRIILEFYLEDPQRLHQKYDELLGFGYVSHQPPYNVTEDLVFAMIDDPDGNTILLSAYTSPEAKPD